MMNVFLTVVAVVLVVIVLAVLFFVGGRRVDALVVGWLEAGGRRRGRS